MSPRPVLWRRASIFGALLLITLLVTSCTGFRQSAAVTLELRFNTWDAVCITKPDTRENGFIPVLTVAETLQEIERRNVPRQLAAIVVGYSYDEKQVLGIASEWQKHLAGLGFQRVVVMRGTDAFPTAGLPIAYDSAISSVNDTPRFTQPYAPASAATRADAANPSIATGR